MIDILVLDFNKEQESIILLHSIQKYCKFPYRVIFLDNGSKKYYSYDFRDKGFIDYLIVNDKNYGLGIGTKQLFEAAQSEYCFYIQNDQYFHRDFLETELLYLQSAIDQNYQGKIIKSVSIAGDTCQGQYSERAHLIKAKFYQSLEPLSEGGCGPKHNLIWREEQIQKIYKNNNYLHYIYQHPLVADNGKRAIRENPDGSLWQHEPDSKRLWLLNGPVKEKFVYPYFTDEEWDKVLETQTWAPGVVPEREQNSSFIVPHWH